MNSKQALIFGASTHLAKSIALELLAKDYTLILSSSNKERLFNTVDELQNHSPNSSIKAIVCDFTSISDFNFFNEKINGEWKDIDDLFFCMGSFENNNNDYLNLNAIDRIYSINTFAPIKLITSAISIWSANPKKTRNIIYISSVSAIRPVKHFIYGSSKIATEYYLRGLSNRNELHFIRIKYFRLGFINENFEKGKFNLLSYPANQIAKEILNYKSVFSNCIYIPRIWILFSAFLKIIPDFIFKKLIKK